MRLALNISVSRVLIVGINPSSARENHLSPTFRRVPKWADYLGLRNYSFINCIPYPGPYKEKDIDREFLYQAVSYHSKVIALDWKSTRLNSSHTDISRMPSSA